MRSRGGSQVTRHNCPRGGGGIEVALVVSCNAQPDPNLSLAFSLAMWPLFLPHTPLRGVSPVFRSSPEPGVVSLNYEWNESVKG